MRLIFAGTPAFAAHALQSLLDHGHEVLLVLTQPDRPAGRGLSLQPSAVKRLALQRSLPVAQPPNLRDANFHAQTAAVNADAMVVAAYGLILPQAWLDVASRGCLNIHASLLPRWRGAAPIQRAILADDPMTGISIMQMDAGLDTGPILAQYPLPIASQDTAQTLHDKLAVLGAEAIVDVLLKLERAELIALAQPESGVTYAEKIQKAEARIDWCQQADAIARAVRAFNPTPGAYFCLGDMRVKVWAAAQVDARGTAGEVLRAAGDDLVVACGEAAIGITELQPAGARRMSARQWLSRQSGLSGMRLT